MSCLRPTKFSTSKHKLPCGTCRNCNKQYIDQWVTKILFEYKSTQSGVLFVTLTYDNEHLPSSENYSGGELSKPDLKLFLRRLNRNYNYRYAEDNKKLNLQPLKYFAVGEYGSQTNRAHYHLLLLNTYPEYRDIEKIIKRSWQLSDPEQIKVDLVGTKGTLDNQSNSNTAGELAASIRYTLKYILKNHGKGTDLHKQSEFTLKTMRPAIGTSYLSEFAKRLRKYNYYPLTHLDPYFRFIFEKIHEDDSKPTEFFKGGFLFYNTGAIDLRLDNETLNRNFFPKSNDIQSKGFIGKLNPLMMEKLSNYFPELEDQVHDYLSTLTPKQHISLQSEFTEHEANRLQTQYNIYKTDTRLIDESLGKTKWQQITAQNDKSERLSNSAIGKL